MSRFYTGVLPRIETELENYLKSNSDGIETIFSLKVDPNTLYGKIVNVGNLLDAFKKAERGGTKYKRGCVNFRSQVIYNLALIYFRLVREMYFPYRYDNFVLYDGKERSIDVPPHSDKIVHHMINNVLLPMFSKMFIPESYACIKGKGTQKAVEKLIEYRKLALSEYGNSCRLLKLDVSKFFPSISQDVMVNILKKYIKCQSTINLLSRIVYGYPKDTGLPLGNLISQLLANLYMHPFDMYCKEVLKIKYYIRYADDLFIFCSDKKTANEWMSKCVNFCSTRLKLTINPQKCYINSPKIVSGLGYKISDKGLALKTKARKNFKYFVHFRDIKRMNSWYIYAKMANCYGFIMSCIKDKGILFNPDDPIPFKREGETEEDNLYDCCEFILTTNYKDYVI